MICSVVPVNSIDGLVLGPTNNARRFPPSWTVECIIGGYKVLEAHGHALASCTVKPENLRLARRSLTRRDGYPATSRSCSRDEARPPRAKAGLASPAGADRCARPGSGTGLSTHLNWECSLRKKAPAMQRGASLRYGVIDAVLSLAWPFAMGVPQGQQRGQKWWPPGTKSCGES